MGRRGEHEEGFARVPVYDGVPELIGRSGMDDESSVKLGAVRGPALPRRRSGVVIAVSTFGFGDIVPLRYDARPDARESVGTYRWAVREREQDLDVPLLGQGNVEERVILVRVTSERMKAGAVEHDLIRVVRAPRGVKADDAAELTG